MGEVIRIDSIEAFMYYVRMRGYQVWVDGGKPNPPIGPQSPKHWRSSPPAPCRSRKPEFPTHHANGLLAHFVLI